jgi:hypothetical protein
MSGEFHEFCPYDGMFVLKDTPFSLIHKFALGIETAVDLPAATVVAWANSCVAGVKAGSGLSTFTSEASALLDSITTTAKGTLPAERKASEIARICLTI